MDISCQLQFLNWRKSEKGFCHTLSRKNIQCRVRTSTCLKLCLLCCFPTKIVRSWCGLARNLPEVEVREELQLLPYPEGLLVNALRLTESILYRTATGHQVLNIEWGPREGTLCHCVWLKVEFQSNCNFRLVSLNFFIPPCHPRGISRHEQAHI